MAKFELLFQVDVSLDEHSYLIYIGKNALNDDQFLQSLVSGGQVLIVSNETIAPIYINKLQKAFVNKQCDVVILPDGEEYKNDKSLFAIYNSLVEHRHHRDTTIVALGGGVVGDIAGFAAATYQRGVKYIQIPTTLLAQVDSSVGGKTAINHPLGKNMIGSFYQPESVIIDISTLQTLPIREFKAGIAEIIKYGLLVGGLFLKDLERELKSGLTASSPGLAKLISECCRIKATYVALDERDQGVRAHLNLGHTFAHALESYGQYARWLHGEAVAIGLYCAAILSKQLGILSDEHVALVENLLIMAELPYKIPQDVELEKLMDLMRLDKKIKEDNIRFIVIKEPGDCYLEHQVTQDRLRNSLENAVEGE